VSVLELEAGGEERCAVAEAAASRAVDGERCGTRSEFGGEGDEASGLSLLLLRSHRY